MSESVPTPLPGRNHPCHCGSGRKYKVCHLAADETHRRNNAPPVERARRFHELDHRMVRDLLGYALGLVGQSGIEAMLGPLNEIRLDDDGSIGMACLLESRRLLIEERQPHTLYR